MDTIVIAGGSGFIGRHLCRFFQKSGFQVVVLSRKPHSSGADQAVHWDGKNLGEWVACLNGTKALINLAGKRIDCALTADNRKEILQSRLDAIGTLHRAIRECANPPKVFIQAGAMGYFGDTKNKIIKEDHPPGNDFFGTVASDYENEFIQDSVPPTTRKVVLRISFALSKDGGVLPKFEGLVKTYLGGTQGTGDQFICWSHIDDIARCFHWAIENEKVDGIYNLCSPNPIRNRKFLETLRAVLGNRLGFPLPASFIKLMFHYVLRMDPLLLLGGRNAGSERLREEGFTFLHPHLKEALEDIYHGL